MDALINSVADFREPASRKILFARSSLNQPLQVIDFRGTSLYRKNVDLTRSSLKPGAE